MSQINETAIRTPGVYTTEIPTLPPSVAQVSTAIPAFIGYTEKRQDEDGLEITAGTIRPIKIFSFFEYQQYFGGAENETGISVAVTLNSDQVVTAAIASITNRSPYNMYYSLRLYFENGGGPCYIVSVGLTSTGPAPVDSALGAGLTALEAFDEPTLILFPEGQALAADEYYNLISLAIDQCAGLQDRFTLVDVHTQAGTTHASIVDGFRGPQGLLKNDSLNYAAAYYPNLRTLFDYQYRDEDVAVFIGASPGSPFDSLADLLVGTPASPGVPAARTDAQIRFFREAYC